MPSEVGIPTDGAALDKPREIVDREPEWATLRRLWESPKAELAFMLGRRRVGKSYVLQRFTAAVDGIYYQATRGTTAEHLAGLSRLLGDHFDDPGLRHGARLPDWDGLLHYVTDRAGEGRLLFVIDEFPYLTEREPALTSVLQRAWDQRWKDRSLVKLLLCGSHITAMRQLEREDQPLYGRRTTRILVAPFDYREMPAFLPAHERRDQLRAYGIFGGLPGHLEDLDPDCSLATNVARLILSPSSRLSDEAAHVLDGFGLEAETHYSALYAIATGAHTWGEIRARVGKSAGALWPVMEWLQAMGLVERRVPVTKAQPQKSKLSLYRIADPYLSFWYRFVLPLYSAGSLGLAAGEELWRSRIAPGLDDHMGGVFEDVCHEFARRPGALPFPPVRIGRWWTRDSTEDIDLVALGPDGELFAAECKWGGVDGRDLETLRKRVARMAGELPPARQTLLGLFSGAGRADARVRRAADAGEVLHFDPEGLYAA